MLYYICQLGVVMQCGSKRKVDYISLMEQLLEKLGDSYIIYLKLHPLDRSSRIPHSKLKMVPDNYEIYEFLSVCDILLLIIQVYCLFCKCT